MDFGPAFVQYDKFLISVSRAGDARRWLARGHDVAPLDPRPLAALGRLNAREGRLDEARRNFKNLDALAASPQETGRTISSNALWTRNHAHTAEIVAALPPSGAPAIAATTVADFMRWRAPTRRRNTQRRSRSTRRQLGETAAAHSTH